MAIFKDYDTVRAWYDQLKPSKKHAGAREAKVLRTSLLVERAHNGAIMVYLSWGFKTNTPCFSAMPDGSFRVYSQGDYYRKRTNYDYLHVYLTQLMDAFLGLNTVTKHGATWLAVRAPGHYEGLGWLPAHREGGSMQFRRAVDNPFELVFVNPKFPQTTRIRRAPLSKAMAPYKDFIAYAEGVCKLLNDEGTVNIGDAPKLLGRLRTDKVGFDRWCRYNIEQHVTFERVCEHMLSDEPEDNYAALIALCLDAHVRKDVYSDKLTLKSKWVRETIRNYILASNPGEYREVVTTMSGRIPSNLT